MSTTLFPSIQPQIDETPTELELYKEVKWDFEKNIPVYQNGSPVILTGKEAVLFGRGRHLQLHVSDMKYIHGILEVKSNPL